MAVKLHIYMFGAKFQIQILYFLSAKMSLFFYFVLYSLFISLYWTICNCVGGGFDILIRFSFGILRWIAALLANVVQIDMTQKWMLD